MCVHRERALGGDASCVTLLTVVVVVRNRRTNSNSSNNNRETSSDSSVCVLSVESVCAQCTCVCVRVTTF